MRPEEATAFLYSLNPKGIRFGLENTRLVLERLGVPQSNFRVIHLAGSNGKGSTAAFLDSILRRAGLCVGLYTSPHLVHFSERFRVDGASVGDELICEEMDRMLEVGLEVDPREVEGWIRRENLVSRMKSDTWYDERDTENDFCRLTFFECTTVLATLLFARAGVEVALMETGMGGRLDATNVFDPEVAVITPIHLEHTQWLGETLEAIAGEKAGIIKSSVPVVCARQHPDALSVIEQVAKEKEVEVDLLDRDFECQGTWLAAGFKVADLELGPVRLGLIGAHQVENAAVALGVLPHLKNPVWPMSREVLEAALRDVSWPGRFERLGPAGEWILDGAHNPDGVKALLEALRDVLAGGQVRLVFGVLGDKDAEQMLLGLAAMAESVHLVRPNDARGREPASLLAVLDREAKLYDSVQEALESLQEESSLEASRAPVLVAGSLTIVGEARKWLLEKGIKPLKQQVEGVEK